MLCSLLLTTAVLEAVFRFFDFRGFYENPGRDWAHALLPEEERMHGVYRQFRPHATFEFTYDSNPRGYFNENNGFIYTVNGHGYRGGAYSMKKPEDTKRIIVLGDSFTFGEGVKLEDTFCSRLEKLLDKAYEAPVEVLNFGICGLATRHEYYYLKQSGLRFEPDLVLLVYVLNDAVNELNVWENLRKEYERPSLRFTYLGSYLASLYARRVQSRAYVEGLVDSALQKDEKWERSLGYLDLSRKITEAADAKFAVAIFPFMYELNDRYPFKAAHELIEGHCEAEGISVVDLFPAFKGENYFRLWVHPSDQHPNEIGHAIAARALADFILREELL